MRPPIPTGTVLQDRYYLTSVLGQGGFARTYLAEDQGRFNELCALKEFIPSQTSEYVLEKSKELFQREAAVLYQIQHPQIPQFRATFEYNLEESPRLFLVQDYVKGKTYHDLLNLRKSKGQTFSEAEVRSLLQQVLPILDYIHAKGIIHRDISPDNLILRDLDQRPVLIDFGVVKEIVTRLQVSNSAAQVTTVGKLGYAPVEQLQTGRAYPSSDLYSLAATTVVLLTGREPQELYDDTTLSWHWQKWAAVSPEFAQILNRMLHYRPGDRYSAASHVLAALQTLPPTAGPDRREPQAVPLNRNLSQVRTMAVDQPSRVSPRQSGKSEPVIPAVTHTSLWDNPFIVAVLGIILALLTGFASWTLVRTLLQQQADPVISVSPTPAISPSPSPEPISYNRPLTLFPGDTLSVQGTLQPNETVNYVFPGQAGQQLAANLSGQGVVMALFGPGQEPVAQRVPAWEGILSSTGEYYLQIKPTPGLSQSSYQLTVSLTDPTPPSPTPTQSPTPTPSPEPTPIEVEVERVQFAEAETSEQIEATVSPGRVKRYLVNAREGQVLSTQVVNGNVTLNIRNPDGELVEDASEVLSWESQLSSSGDYRIDVVAEEETDFILNISVRDLE